MAAVVRAESGDVRQWLRGQEESIRASLAEQGLTLDELVVEDDGSQRRDQEQQAEEQRRRAPLTCPSQRPHVRGDGLSGTVN